MEKRKVNLNLSEYDEVIHISHIDLDGYSAQFLVDELLNQGVLKYVKYFNLDYHEDKEVFNKVFEYILSDKSKSYYVLITDIGLKAELVTKIKNFMRGNKNIKLYFQVIDHHKSGAYQDVDWYYYDKEFCATKLVYDELVSPMIREYIKTHKIDEDGDNSSQLFYLHGLNMLNKHHLKDLAQIVNAYDVWKLNDEMFYYGSNLSDVVMNFIKYPKEFERSEYRRNHIFGYIKKFMNRFLGFNYRKNVSIQELQSYLYFDNTEVLYEMNNDEYYSNVNIPYEYKLHYHYYKLYKDSFDEFEWFEIDNYKFKILSIDSNLFQNVSHFLMDDETLNIQMIANVKPDGKVSLRSVGDKYDVSIFAFKYLENGGGHFNAAGSGGKIKIDDFFDQQSLEKAFKTYLKAKIV